MDGGGGVGGVALDEQVNDVRSQEAAAARDEDGAQGSGHGGHGCGLWVCGCLRMEEAKGRPMWWKLWGVKKLGME